MNRSKTCAQFFERKFFYLFTCEYCFSHYVALGVVWASGFRLLQGNSFSFFATWFALVWAANWLTGTFAIMRQALKWITQRAAIAEQDKDWVFYDARHFIKRGRNV